jgi:copper chaperone CopZ
VSGTEVPNTGRDVLYLTARLRARIVQRFSVEVGLRIPVYQHVNLTQYGETVMAQLRLVYIGRYEKHTAAPEVAPAHEVVTILSLRELSCESCGAAVEAALKKTPGVHFAHFDRDRVEVTVHHSPDVQPGALVRVVEQAGYKAEPGPGRGAYLPEATFPPGSDVQWIARGGADVDLEPHRAAGKVTVFDFYATWCGPCREVDAEMAKILAEDSDVALRKIDVGTWDSPVAKHYLAGASGLPFIIVDGRNGARVRTIAGLDLAALRAAIAEGKSK